MACTLTNIPGFALAHASRLLEESRPKLLEILCRTIGRGRALALLDSPAICLCPGPEAFSERSRRHAYTSHPVADCVYDFKQTRLYVNAAAVERPYFLARLFLNAGYIAYLAEDETLKVNDALSMAAVQIRKRAQSIYFPRMCLRLKFEPQIVQIPKARTPACVLLEEIETRLQKGTFLEVCHKKRPNAYDRAMMLLLRNLERFSKGDCPQRTMPESPEEVPLALAANASLADFSLPSTTEFFGQENDIALQGDYTVSLPTPLSLKADDGTVPWVATPDDGMPISKAQKFHPLAALSLRPVARLQARLFQDYRANTTNAIRNFQADLPSEEADPICVLPYHKASNLRRIRLCGAQVGENLGWAVLQIQIERKKRAVPALSSLWAMQASRLMLGVDYDAKLSFWARSLGSAKTTSDVCTPGFPWIDTTFVFERELNASTLGQLTFVTLQGKIRSTAIEVVVQRTLYEAVAPRKGDRLAISGIYLLGELEPYDRVKRIVEWTLSKPNRFQGRREIGFLATAYMAPALLARALLTKPKSKQLRQRRLTLVRKAAELKFAPASFLLSQYLRRNKQYYSALQEIAQSAAKYFVPAMRYLIRKTWPAGYLPFDIADGVVSSLASEYNDSRAQYIVSQRHSFRAKRSIASTSEATCALSWLLQSVANGNNAAAYELSRTYALGEAENPTLARAILLMAVQRNYAPAQYWLAAYDRIGEALFTATSEQKEALFKHRVEEGIPAAQLLLGLFYEFDCPQKPRAPLYAHALYSWVERTLHDLDAKELREALEKHIDGKWLSELPFLDLWKELDLKEPPKSLPLEQLTAELAPGPVMMHPSFIRSIDTLQGDTPSERLMRQIAFVAENCAPVRIGLACEEGYEPTRDLRVSGFGVCAGITELNRALLLVAASQSDSRSPWDVASIYPIFEHANNVIVYLQGAIASFSHACGLLALSPQGPTRGSSSTLVAFDPLWPSLKNRYRTNERYSAALYGIVETLTVRKNFFEGLPEEVLQAIHQAVPNAKAHRHDRLVSFGAVDISNALYRINASVRSVDPNYAEVFSVPFIKLEVDAFLPNEYAGNTFTLYVTQERLEGKPLPKVGERIDVLFELNAYMLATDNTLGAALN